MHVRSLAWKCAPLVFLSLVGVAVGQPPPDLVPPPPPPPTSGTALAPPNAAAVPVDNAPVDNTPVDNTAPVAASNTDTDAAKEIPDWDKPVQDSASAREFIRALAASHIPNKYENTKQWGKKRRMTTGVKVSLDGLRVDSERRVKEVNDGSWKRYRIDRKPGDDALELSVERVEQRDDGTIHVDLACRAKLLVTGRWAQWERGVQLMSVGMEADADVRLKAGCDVKVELNPLKLPPDVTLRPTVTNAQLELIDLRLRRVGALEGPVAKQLGEALEEVLQDRLLDENRQLADKLNRQLQKKPDRFKFSFQDWASRKWEKLAPK